MVINEGEEEGGGEVEEGEDEGKEARRGYRRR